MITAGIDMGAKNVKVVILEDGKVKAKSLVVAGIDTKAAANEAYDKAIQAAGVSKDDVKHITATGAGQEDATFANDMMSDVTSAAAGCASSPYPSMSSSSVFSRAFIASSPRRMWNGSPLTGTHRHWNV